MKTLLILLTFLISTHLSAQERIQAGALKVALTSLKAVTKVPMGNYLGSYSYPLAHRYTMSAYVDGFVKEVNTKPFSKVKKGQNLFVIQSPKLLDLQSEYINTLLELEFYTKELKRLKPLSEQGVIASKRYIETKNKYDKFKAVASFQESLLKAYGLSGIQLNKVRTQHMALSSLLIKAPANATVSELNLQVGSFISQGDILAKLVDTSECHFEIDLPWKLTRYLKKGDTLYTNNEIFTLIAISPDIDPISQTRGVDLHGKEGCHSRGGASMNVTLFQDTNAFEVPASAIVNVEGVAVVFVKHTDGYEMIKVKVLAQYEGHNFIQGKLSKGDKIASSSVLALKSAYERSQE